ncbi:STAS domain-containing protein [Synechococcus sp. W65.1]|jgi:anti-sigma B factor antagonist|uniref:STAS domain-containing protein n=1 Tax=unclassified Synechococcus TaxID=2626047 RepID=UPI0039C3C97A
MNFKLRIRTAETPQGQKLAIVPLEGRFDAKAASEARQLLQQVLDFGYTNLLIDMSAVTFMDSSGLGVLISALRKCRAAGGNLGLCGVPESVALVLRLTSMEKVLTCFDDLETGIANFPTASSDR